MTRMEDCLERCESLEVDIEELEHVLLAPNEQRVDIRHQRLFHTFSRQGGHELWVASAARWDEHERVLTTHEQKCQELSQAIEQIGERQELLVAMMERKKLCKEMRQKNFKCRSFKKSRI